MAGGNGSFRQRGRWRDHGGNEADIICMKTLVQRAVNSAANTAMEKRVMCPLSRFSVEARGG
jgi:hypothetical protein